MDELLAFDLTFQSTLPIKGVTFKNLKPPLITNISIHTPNKGSDSKDSDIR